MGGVEPVIIELFDEVRRKLYAWPGTGTGFDIGDVP